MMDVYFDTATNESERSEVEQWRTTHDASDIEYVSIGLPSVFVHGCNRQFGAVTGTASRKGKLGGELTAALAVMRKARDI